MLMYLKKVYNVEPTWIQWECTIYFLNDLLDLFQSSVVVKSSQYFLNPVVGECGGGEP